MRYFAVISLIFSILVTHSLKGDVSLPKVFSDNMVLQQQQALPVWGWAAPGEVVTVAFADQTISATAKPDGTWMIRLKPLQASNEPATFTVKGTNTIVLQNVVVGEVWLCSGQSNMAMAVQRSVNAQAEMESANFPLIRHFYIPHLHRPIPQNNVNARWVATTPETIANQSAVAYFFGRQLHRSLNVPIGLINASWGGTRIEPWTPSCGFESLPTLSNICEHVNTAMPTTAKHKQVLADYLNNMQAWIKQAQKRSSSNQPQSLPPVFPENLVFSQDKGAQQQPTVLYNGMISGIVPFAIKGAIWYQGESNNGEGMLYLDKTKALVQGWRKVWQQGNFPYYLVQLAPYKYGARRAQQLPELWEAQTAVTTVIPNTGMTVINDIATLNDIHPPNKQDVGLRLANQVLHKDYGRKEIVWSGPLYRSFTIAGNSMRIEFDHAEGLQTRDNKAPDWFEIAGSDNQFKPATATIEGSSVILRAAGVETPLAMRFAWSEVAEPNLINGAGLPTSAFRCGK